MIYDPEIHHRRSVRIKEFDYSQEGGYFITICAYKHKYLFGKIVNGNMMLNEYGDIINQYWLEIPNHFPQIEIGEFVIMPNHIHGIINIVGARHDVPSIVSPETISLNTVPSNLESKQQFGKPMAGSISTIIGLFKSTVTKRIKELKGISNTPIWQRGFYEHVIRDEDDFNKINEYIINNSLKWEEDKYFQKMCNLMEKQINI